MTNIFLYLVVTHFVTDFMLQIWGIGVNKKGLNKYMIAHIFITFFTPMVLLLILNFDVSKVFKILSFMCMSHLVIDVIRQEIHSKYKITPNDRNFWILLGVDQILHVYFIYLGINWFLS